MHSEAQGIQAVLTHLVEAGADAPRVADAAVAVWRSVDAALSPIVGERGVDALFKRSLYLQRDECPWLAAAHEVAPPGRDFQTLHAALAQRTGADAATANAALLLAFCDLLSTLIGAPLTERLLRHVLNPPSSGDAAQDITP